jgi:hypothetical protein
MKRGVLVGAALLAVLLVVVVVRPWRGNDAPSSTASEANGAQDESATQSDAVGAEEPPSVVASDQVASEAGSASTLVATTTDETQRQPAPVAAQELEIVVTSDSRPLEGAVVVFAPVLHDPPWDMTAEPHSWEREEVRGAFTVFSALATLRTDARGSCTVRQDQLATSERSIVIAVMHERAYGELRAIQTVDLPGTERVEFALEAAAPVRAIVRGAAPGERVEVTQAALYGNFRESEFYTDEWVSRPMLRYTHVDSGGGAVALFPVRDRNLVAARAGLDVSAPYVGSLAGDIDLAVGPSFTVEGRTIDLDQPMVEALVRVLAFDESTQRWSERGVGAMQTDGTFGPMEVAWLDGASRWQARAEAVDYFTATANFEPSPRARSYVEFDASNSVRYEVRVVDGITNEIIVGALVTIDWDGRVDPPWSERTLETGEAMFAHLPIGTRLFIDVEADGYAKEPTGIFPTEAITDPRAIVIPVFPKCRVEGRIAPAAAGLEVMHAELERVLPVATRGQRFDVEVEGGAFEFDGLGGESASLFLYNERGSCGPIVIAQGTGLVDIGTVELVPHASARVRVIDGVTGGPLVDAEVDVRMEDGTYESVAVGEPVRSDDRGEVRFERFPGNGAWLRVRAPGMTAALATEAEFDGVTYDFGDFALQPERVFEVELAGGPRRPQHFTLAEWLEPPRTAAFDEAGRARVPVQAEAQYVQLIDPAGRVELFRAVSRLADLPQPFVWHAPTGRLLLSVVGVDESYEQYRNEHQLVISWFDGAGWYERTVAFTCAFGALPTRRVPAANVSYRVSDGDGRLRCWGRVDLAASGDQELVIDLGRDVATLRLLDADGAPVPNVYVRGFDRRAPAANHASSVGNFRTDANGEAFVPLLEGGALGLALLGPNGEVVPDVDTTGWRAGAVEEIVFAPSGAIDVVVRSRGGAADADSSAVAGAIVTLHTSDERLYFARWTSDDAGRVQRSAIDAARYVLEVTRPGHWSRKLPIDVASGGATQIDVLLPELARLEVKVVDASGAPLANTSVELLHEALDEFHSEWLAAGRVGSAAVTDVAGRLALDGVPAGTYVVGVGGYEMGTAATGAGVATVVVR